MKRHYIYECEICGAKSEDIQDILQCEANHYGLTISEKKEYDNLKRAAELSGKALYVCKNNKTNQAFEKAVNDMINFEKEHGFTFCDEEKSSVLENV